MKKLSFTLLILLVFSTSVAAQARASDLIWSPDRQIQFSDYQAFSRYACVEVYEMWGFITIATVEIRGMVDVPQNWRGENDTRPDRGYIVPFMCRINSCYLFEDSISLKVDNLLFDTTELFARRARMELAALRRQHNVPNFNSTHLTRVRLQQEQYMRSMFDQIRLEILIENQDGAYNKWREQVNALLEETQDFATSPQDRHRFTYGPAAGFVQYVRQAKDQNVVRSQ